MRGVSVLVAAALAASVSAGAATGGAVATAGFTYVPGDARAPAGTLVVAAGSGLTFVNLEAIASHSATSDGSKPTGSALFDSGIHAPGESSDVAGVSSLARGTYGFHCRVHPTMHGRLVIQ